MKKLKFTTKPAIALYAMLAVVFLCGCDGSMKSDYGTERTIWVVIKVEHEGRGMASYRILPINKKDLTVNDTWLEDSVGRFEIGDTVCVGKKNY